MKRVFFTLIALAVCCWSFDANAQGPSPQYPGPGTSVGFSTACGLGGADGIPSVGGAVPFAGTDVCGFGISGTLNPMIDNGADGFDIMVDLDNFPIAITPGSAYDMQVIWFPSNEGSACGCGICFDMQLDAGFGGACADFGPQLDWTLFGAPPDPVFWGNDVFGATPGGPQPIIAYTDLCPNTQYDVLVSFFNTTSNADVFDLTDDPVNGTSDGDGDGCGLDGVEIIDGGFVEGPFSIIGPGARETITIANETITVAAGSACGDANITFDWSADIVAGCVIPGFDNDGPALRECSNGLEVELSITEACSGLAFDSGALIGNPTVCFIGGNVSGQIIVSGADVCAALACNAAATIEIYVYHTFCEAQDINGDGSGVDEALTTFSLATAIGGDIAACCAAPACDGNPDYTAADVCSGDAVTLSPGAGCTNPVSAQFPGDDRYDYFIGYYDSDLDGVPDGTAPGGYDPLPAASVDITTYGGAPDPNFVITDVTSNQVGFPNGSQCGTDVTLPALPANQTCAPITYSVIIVPVDYDSDVDGDLGFGDVLTVADGGCPAQVIDVVVYPEPLTIDTTTGDEAACGTPVAILESSDGTACATQSGIDAGGACVANGDELNWDFSADATITALAGAPAACAAPATLTGTLTCAGCGGAPVCDIVTVVSNIVCDDNGTPADPTDDTFTFDVTVTQLDATFTTFSSDGGDPAGTAYGSVLSYGPFPISGGTVTITYTDDTDANCTETADGVPPAPCSGCAADAGAFCAPGP